MNFRVWRLLSDNSVVGYCDESNVMFEPGGDLSLMVVSIEKEAPKMPPPPKTPEQLKKEAVLADATVPQSVKDYLALT